MAARFFSVTVSSPTPRLTFFSFVGLCPIGLLPHSVRSLSAFSPTTISFWLWRIFGLVRRSILTASCQSQTLLYHAPPLSIKTLCPAESSQLEIVVAGKIVQTAVCRRQGFEPRSIFL